MQKEAPMVKLNRQTPDGNRELLENEARADQRRVGAKAKRPDRMAFRRDPPA
jgi:hypothetical protein